MIFSFDLKIVRFLIYLGASPQLTWDRRRSYLEDSNYFGNSTIGLWTLAILSAILTAFNIDGRNLNLDLV